MPSLHDAKSAAIVARLHLAREVLHGISHGLLKPDKIQRILDSARSSAGVPLLGEETAMLRAIAEEAHRALRAFKRAHHLVEELANSGAPARMAPATGRATAVVLTADVGDPAGYSSARAYTKTLGLNLKEKSSGKLQGRLAITKRGPSRARQFLWLAVCRWMRRDQLARASEVGSFEALTRLQELQRLVGQRRGHRLQREDSELCERRREPPDVSWIRGGNDRRVELKRGSHDKGIDRVGR